MIKTVEKTKTTQMLYLINTSSVPQIGVTHWSSVISKCQWNPQNIMFVVHLMVGLLDCFLCFVIPSSLLLRLDCPTIELFPVSSLAPTFSFLYLKFLPILIRTFDHCSVKDQVVLRLLFESSSHINNTARNTRNTS